MYSLKSLPFLYQDLEPFIDTHTMGLHYQKHQRNYLNQLNQLLLKNAFSFSYPMEELYHHLSSFAPKEQNQLLFYLGGVLNHDLYWQSINPKNKELPTGPLKEAINQKFGSFDKMKEKWIEYALNIKGSGYVFLVKTGKDNIEIITTMNQDNPLQYGYLPLFCTDMWEHAYYLNNKDDKRKYLENFFEIANFSYANQHYK